MFDRAVEEATARYAAAGRVTYQMIRAKLRSDPVYRELLDRGVADARKLVDLGCGRGLLLSLILSARGGRETPALHGIDIAPSVARLASRALGDQATIVEGDLAENAIPSCDVVTLLDAYHYLPVRVQDGLLARIRAALPEGGRLFIREADAAAGAGFYAVRVAERFAAILRGDGFRGFAYRSIEELSCRLDAAGFSVAVTPMGRRTPFSNVLVEARARA